MQPENTHGRRRRRPGRNASGPTTAGGGATPLEPLGVPPKEAFRIISCGITKGYQLIANGELDVYKIGRATRITLDSIRAYVARQVAASSAPKAA